MATSESRRSFMGFAFGSVAAVGGVFSLVAMKKLGIRFQVSKLQVLLQ